MTKPAFPLICISKGTDLEIIPDENCFSKIRTSALIDTNFFTDTFFFDKNNIIWSHKQVSDKFKNNFFTKLLAMTFYNPLLDTKVIWNKVGTYYIKELQDQLKYCVDKDDDIITQFEEADVIKLSLEQAMTFDDILKVLNKYVFDVNEEELWKEQEERQK
jgi:hypothetical protein